jgi:hypothetical protein
VVFAIFVLAGVLLAGCGASSSGSSAPAGTVEIPKAEFISKADRLCEANAAKLAPLHAKLQRLSEEVAGQETKGARSDVTRKELVQTFERVDALTEAGLTRLRGLGRPDAGAALVKAIFQQIETAIAVTRSFARAIEHNEDALATEILKKGDSEALNTASLAKQFGFRVCGTAPQPK